MLSVASKIRPQTSGRVRIVSAKVPRALESAQVLEEFFNTKSAETFSEFYAAPEDSIFADVPRALNLVESLVKASDTLIVVASKEYVEALAEVFLKVSTKVARAEFVAIDCSDFSRPRRSL